MVDFDALIGHAPDVEVDLAALHAIEGWLGEPAVHITKWLVRLQLARSAVTGVLELGVHHGRYLALMTAAHVGAKVPVVGVDALLQGDATQLSEEYRQVAIANVRRNVRSVAGDDADVEMIGSFTRDLDLEAVRALCPAGFSFISVDAGHEEPDAAVDLDIAVALASPGAVIAIDDAFNPRTPGVNEALSRHLAREGTGGLLPFASGGNKLFATTTEDARQLYLAYCHWLMDTSRDAEFVAESARVRELNRTHRFVPEYFGYEVATFHFAG